MTVDDDVTLADEWLVETDRCVLIGPSDPGAVMSEGLLMQVGPSVLTQWVFDIQDSFLFCSLFI